MPEFGARSKKNLEGVHPDLAFLFRQVVKHFDCTITAGLRSDADQAALYAQGRTKPGKIVTQVDGVTKRSKHQVHETPEGKYAIAVDAAPFPIDWNDIDRFRHFAGFVLGMAAAYGIPVRSGVDWDGDTELDDQSFMDLPHFELALDVD